MSFKNQMLAVRVLFLTVFLVTTALAQHKGVTRMATLSELSEEFRTLAEQVSPAVVQIIATGYVPSDGRAANPLAKERSSGSGVILDPQGYIVTNAHVVAGAKRLQVVLALNETQYVGQSVLKPRGKIVGARIVGVDRETDLAVVKIDQTGLPFLRLGDSEKVQKGQIVMAFGSPLGLENSVTMGVVSSVARQLESGDPMIYIQTDAPINPGNSGGPLVATSGEVVGINTLIFSQSGGNEGIGFAAPSNIVQNVYTQIRSTGRVKRGIIGAHTQTVTPLLAAGLHLPVIGKVIVSDVEPYSPAAEAGLKVGDIILTMDGKTMENARQFDVNLYKRGVGDAVVLDIQRGEIHKKIKVEIVERPDDPERFSDLVSPERNLIRRLDILGLDLTEELKKMLPKLRIESGVVVANRANLLYEQGEFLPGDVIHNVNGEAIETLSELKSLITNLDVYSPVVVQVERLGRFRYVVFELE